VWPFERDKQGAVVHHWAVVTSSGDTIASFSVRKTPARYTMTHDGTGEAHKYPTVALAYEAMIGLCVKIVYPVWEALITERETGVRAALQDPKVVNVVEVLLNVNRAIPLAQIQIDVLNDGLDIVRFEIADPTTREPINPPRAITLATAGPQ
jgi:hypothetical protein